MVVSALQDQAMSPHPSPVSEPLPDFSIDHFDADHVAYRLIDEHTGKQKATGGTPLRTTRTTSMHSY